MIKINDWISGKEKIQNKEKLNFLLLPSKENNWPLVFKMGEEKRVGMKKENARLRVER